MNRTDLPVAVLVPVLVPVLVLAACSDDGGRTSSATPASPATSAATPPTTSPTAPPTASPTTAPTATSGELVQDLPAFSVGPNGVIADVTTEVCDSGPGPVTASGTATNSGRFGRDVVVVVSWVVPETGDVVARALARVEDLAPGQTRDWSLSTAVPAGEQLLCVPTAQAGQLAQP